MWYNFLKDSFRGVLLRHLIISLSTHKLVVLIPEQYNKLVLCQLQVHLALWLRNKSVISHLWLKIAHTPWHILNMQPHHEQ